MEQSLTNIETRERIERMKALYGKTTKHSHYQIMPDFLAELVDPSTLNKKHSRYEKERMAYFTRHLDFGGKKVLDVGANTGFFSFGSVSAGASKVVAVEGNAEHAEFLRMAAQLFHKPVELVEGYLDFKGEIPGSPFDIVLLLNVLHHVGDDFGDRTITIAAAKQAIIDNLNYFADKTQYLVLQIGFSWKTNYDLPLFEHGTKAEMIAMFREGIKDHWEEVAIGIPEVSVGVTQYHELSGDNVARIDALGEFRNRPVFILRSKLA